MKTKKTPSPPIDPIHEAMQDLRRLVRAIEGYSRSVENRFGLTGPQLWALWELGRASPLSLKELAERMHLSSSTLVGVIDRLVAKGLVTREQDSGDRRRIRLGLTPAGTSLWKEAPHPAQGQLIEGLRTLEPAQMGELGRSLKILVRAMEAEGMEARFFFSEE